MHKAHPSRVGYPEEDRYFQSIFVTMDYASRNGSEEQLKLLRADCRTVFCSHKRILFQSGMITCHSGGALPFVG